MKEQGFNGFNYQQQTLHIPLTPEEAKNEDFSRRAYLASLGLLWTTGGMAIGTFVGLVGWIAKGASQDDLSVFLGFFTGVSVGTVRGSIVVFRNRNKSLGELQKH